MADTGWKFPGTAVGNRTVFGSGADWSNPDNIKADDGSNASASPFNTYTSGLAASNFTFSVPAGATIDGIEARVGDFAMVVGTSNNWWRCNLILADDSDGSEFKASELPDPTTSLQTGEAGGAADLWSETIAESDVEDVDWGFFVSFDQTTGVDTMDIDFMQMKVYYTEGGSFPYHALLPRKRSMNALMTL